jgi:hypothetical protein
MIAPSLSILRSKANCEPNFRQAKSKGGQNQRGQRKFPAHIFPDVLSKELFSTPPQPRMLSNPGAAFEPICTAGRLPAFAAVPSCGDMLLSLPLRFRVKKAFSWFWELFVENACSGSMMP